MKNKYLFVTILLLALALTGFGFTKAYVSVGQQKEREELLIVTSFYPMYVAALNIAGECPGVIVENLSEPQTGCLHDYQLTPQDMILLSEADVFVVNGGGIETFLTDVAEKYPELTIINAGAEIFGESSYKQGQADKDNEEMVYEAEEVHEEEAEVHMHEEMYEEEAEVHIHEEMHEEEEHVHEEVHEEEDIHEEVHDEDSHAGHNHGENAHVWMSMHHYMEQIQTICKGLQTADPLHKDRYETAANLYLEKIERLHQEAEVIREAAEGKSVVIFHEAFEFFSEDFGMQIAGELNLDEERQVSAREVADILNMVESGNVEMVLAEELYGKDMGDTIEKETTCKVFYLDTLVRGEENKDSWLLGMEQNLQLLKEALDVR